MEERLFFACFSFSSPHARQQDGFLVLLKSLCWSQETQNQYQISSYPPYLLSLLHDVVCGEISKKSMDLDILLDDSDRHGTWNITQVFHHTNFETSAANDHKMTLNTAGWKISRLCVTSVPESRIMHSASLYHQPFSSCSNFVWQLQPNDLQPKSGQRYPINVALVSLNSAPNDPNDLDSVSSKLVHIHVHSASKRSPKFSPCWGAGHFETIATNCPQNYLGAKGWGLQGQRFPICVIFKILVIFSFSHLPQCLFFKEI